ncbi:uncharacterized protein MYCFIDRAFT_173074 [Pseudocercospora fijiensis CIRAD86]|uniref:FMN hydroxy acid dehydrogenase domain-containing protein n=1 Tax=Pseudocercospora fijiensis (strain CIRAD86) TaxID=383855 RepID=M2ZYI3_PSEFD|nr:uncharacterized protein MYCFIDRAFT_173074 [Pseudocercospora fijiensis CIRAD86]EME84009.1 hypothetical protein MYCFIDRAFT_173074 [Pseudocercospora fijiensis CIRAD86]
MGYEAMKQNTFGKVALDVTWMTMMIASSRSSTCCVQSSGVVEFPAIRILNDRHSIRDDLPPSRVAFFASIESLAMVTTNENEKYRTTRDSMMAKSGPSIPMRISWKKKALQKLNEGGWYYASSNSDEPLTHLANRHAFYRHKIITRMLVDTNKRDTAPPIGFSAVSVNKIYHPWGELPVAKVAKELNLPHCLSIAGSSSSEDVAEGNGEGPRFFQLHMPHDDELTFSTGNPGFTACILTVDTNYVFYHRLGADLGLTDQREMNRSCLAWTCMELGEDALADQDLEGAVWREAVCDQVRYDGIVLSNHAGIQVDGGIVSMDALEDVVDAVRHVMKDEIHQ